MCGVSAVSDYYMRPNWPGQLNPVPNPYQGLGVPPTLQHIVQSDPETKELLRKVVEMLDKIDKRLGDVDCMDEKKAAFYQALDMEVPKEGKS